MFDFDSGKLLILGLIALIVIKPKDLPGVMRQVGATIGQLRRMAGEFQGQFRDALREAELEEIRKDVAKATDIQGLDPFADVKSGIEKTRAEIDQHLANPLSEHTFAESIEVPPAAPASPAPADASPATVAAPAPAQPGPAQPGAAA